MLWEGLGGGARLLRIHHTHGKPEEAAVVATQLPYPKFVMLAGDYASAVVWQEGEHVSYTEVLRERLGSPQYMRLGVAGCCIFFSLTL